MKNRSIYYFKILWSQTYIGIAINANEVIPLTTFYFWPNEDGWNLLKEELDSKPWILQDSKIEILNSYTNLINYWIINLKKKTNKLSTISDDLDLNLEVLGVNLSD